MIKESILELKTLEEMYQKVIGEKNFLKVIQEYSGILNQKDIGPIRLAYILLDYKEYRKKPVIRESIN